MILDDPDTANRINFVPSQIELNMMFSGETFLKVTNNEM